MQGAAASAVTQAIGAATGMQGLNSDLTFNGAGQGLWVDVQQSSEDTSLGAIERNAPQYADPNLTQDLDEAGARYQRGVREGLWMDLLGIVTLDPFEGALLVEYPYVRRCLLRREQ